MHFSSNKSDHSKDPEPTVLRPYHEQNGPGSSLFHFKVTPPVPQKGTPDRTPPEAQFKDLLRELPSSDQSSRWNTTFLIHLHGHGT